jgi:hypothetical protein
MYSVEKVEVREPSASEIKQVAGGNTGLWVSIGVIVPTPRAPKPIQG